MFNLGFSMLVASVLFLALPFVTSQDTVSYDFDSYGDDSDTPFQTFLSNTDVKPPVLQINSNQSGLADGYIFFGVNGDPTSEQKYPVIYEMSEDRMGTLIWSGNYTDTFDFRTQTYKGDPVLTFWAGEHIIGFGFGSFYMLNQSYAEIAHFSPVGFEEQGDLHEFTITSDDTALVAIYHIVPYDLSSMDGPEDGWLIDSIFQEIDIETGDLIFEWKATDHVGLDESYNSLETVGDSEDAPWDYFHINSIEKDANGDYLVSARVMDCVYKISGDDGEIIWRMGGKQSDFDIEDDALFAFQHDARWVNPREQARMTLFDNGPRDDEEFSRGLLLEVDQDEMTVSLIQEFMNNNRTFAQYEGSFQAINPEDEDTNYMIGYGSQPYFTECDKDGNILLDVQFGVTNLVNAYRTYRLPWQGMPLTKPDIHYGLNSSEVYFSWNGATDIEEWVLFTANATNSSRWANLTSVRRTGFETALDLTDLNLGQYIRGKAVNSSGGMLGWTMASDGEGLFDAFDDPEEASLEDLVSSSSSSSSSSRSSTSATSTSASETEVPSSTTTGAAARITQGIIEQVYVVAVVAVGGIALA